MEYTPNYLSASPSDRLRSIYPGDPVGDYHGFPDIQASIIEQERYTGVEAVLSAADRLKDLMEPTPLEPAVKLSEEMGVPVFFKREDTTAVHSFKLRGAFNKMSQLSPEEMATGVLAASAGNHAQGVALSAQRLGIQATIVMPKTTPEIKVNAVKKNGAEAILVGDNYSEAYDYSQKLAQESNKAFIHPFDDPEVIAGQGTIGKEILDDMPDVTHIFVPIGGGGLIAGIGQYVKPLSPNVKIIGVQAEDSNAMLLSLQAGELVTLPHVGTLSDGTAVKEVGANTFALAQQYVDEVVTVNADQIAAANAAFFEETRGMLEPAGALSIAGLQVYSQKNEFEAGSKAVTICSGSNISLEKIRFLVERAEVGRGREALFAIALPEVPGALHRLCQEVVNGHRVTEFNYRFTGKEQAQIFVGFSMAGEDDKEAFMQKLTDNDYSFNDLSNDDIAKEHIRHMIGGANSGNTEERLYEVEFPERPGSLAQFLEGVGDRWNISLFHYRSLGGDTSKVMIGFVQPDTVELERLLGSATSSFSPVSSQAARIFL